MLQASKMLNDMTIIELKALVYDLLAQQQATNRQIQIVQEKINSELTKSQKLPEPVEEKNV